MFSLVSLLSSSSGPTNGSRHTFAFFLCLALAPYAILFLWIDEAAACSACACGDPTLTAMGSGKPFVGRLRLSIEERVSGETSEFVSQQPWALDNKKTLSTYRGTTVVALSAVISPEIMLSAEGSYVVQRTTDGHSRALWTAGPSDVTLRGKWFFWHDRPYVPRQLMALSFSTRTPWPLPVVDKKGRQVQIDSQPSLGAHFFEGALSYSAFPTGLFRPLSFYASVRAFVATPGFENYLAGPGVGLTVSGQFQPTPALAIQTGFDTRSTLPAIDARNLFDDEDLQELAPGGHLLMPHVALLFSPMMDLVIRLMVRVPLVDTRAPAATEHPQVLVGMTWDF